MGRKSKFTSKQKIEACEKYINGYGSICSISDELGIAYETFRRWLLKYRINQPFIEDIIWMIIYYIVAVILSFTISIVWNKIVLLLKKILKSFPAIIINKKC